MTLHLEEATKADAPGIIDCLFDAYSDPYHPFYNLLYPGAGHNDPEAKPAAIVRIQERWEENQFEHWLKVTDSDIDQIIGYYLLGLLIFFIDEVPIASTKLYEADDFGPRVSRWVIYHGNPFPNGPPRVEATWHPDGSLIREYTTHLMNDRLERQAARCKEANVWLGNMGVRPAYRRRGAASMMVQWGVERAEEIGVEAFVEASWHGSQVYRRFGFQYVDDLGSKRPPEKEGDVNWDELEKTNPFEGEWLWRPRVNKSSKTESGLQGQVTGN